MARKPGATIAVAALGMALALAGPPALAEAGTGRKDAHWSAELLATGMRNALSTLERIDDDRFSVGTWFAARLGWIEELATWRPRSRALMPWMRLFGNGVDSVLGLVDPSGFLPRFDLQEYRVLLVHPIEGEISSEYGYREDPIHGRRRFHKGLDFAADRGTPVRAAGPGIVRLARRWGKYGRVIVIDHGRGVETRYAHLSRYRVTEGDYVAANALIGFSGSTGRTTGPHLHFEVRQDGRAVDPRRAFVDAPPPAPEPANAREFLRFWVGADDSGISLKPGS